MIVYTAIQPTGNITLGNYIGSLKNFAENLKGASKAYLSVADLHSLTINPNPDELKENIKQLLSLFFALDLQNHADIFIQSQISAHTQLAWILSTVAKMGELERMTQYKDKTNNNQNANVGLFTYPILMASDILLYDANIVPVGQDQKQHLELTRDLANRFNSMYQSEIFSIPQPIIKKQGSKIYSLTDPSKKMSKSDDNPKSYITLFDDPKTIEKKIKSATTDSIGKINFDEKNQPGVSNLLVIYAQLTNQDMYQTLKYFENQNYGFLKQEVAKVIIDHLQPIQQKVKYYYENFDIIKKYLNQKHQEINQISQEKITQINKIIGI